MKTQPQPGSAHLRAARELLVCLAAGATRFTEDDAKYGAEILAKHFPAAPALTGGDAELRQTLLTCDGAGKKAKEDALNELLRIGAAAIHDAASRQHTNRITALSAQVAQEKDHHEFYRGKVSDYMGAEIKWQEAVDRLKSRIAELERDVELLQRYHIAGRDMNDSVERFIENRDRLGDGHEAVLSRIEQMRRDLPKWKAAMNPKQP